MTRQRETTLRVLPRFGRSLGWLLVVFLSCRVNNVDAFANTRRLSTREEKVSSARSRSLISSVGSPPDSLTPGRRPSVVALSMWNNDNIEGSNRYKACFPYLLPLLDGNQFGNFIYLRIPPLGFLNEVTIAPLESIYHSVPFLGVAFFVALTLGTRFNMDMDRNVRFNAQQAALIDVALILPELIASCLEGEDLPLSLVEPCNNFVWYAYMTAVVYSIVSNLRGEKPNQIPIISEASDLMVGPF